MAVNKENQTDTESTLKITNGDLLALKKIKEEYNLNDEADVLTFALGVLSQAKGKPLSIERDDGSILKLAPSEKLKKQAS